MRQGPRNVDFGEEHLQPSQKLLKAKLVQCSANSGILCNGFEDQSRTHRLSAMFMVADVSGLWMSGLRAHGLHLLWVRLLV